MVLSSLSLFIVVLFVVCKERARIFCALIVITRQVNPHAVSMKVAVLSFYPVPKKNETCAKAEFKKNINV